MADPTTLAPATKLSPGFALFNCHINNARSRATQELRDMGCGDAADEIEAKIEERGGIMGLSNDDHPLAGVFVGLICAFVNENRAPVST